METAGPVRHSTVNRGAARSHGIVGRAGAAPVDSPRLGNARPTPSRAVSLFRSGAVAPPPLLDLPPHDVTPRGRQERNEEKC